MQREGLGMGYSVSYGRKGKGMGRRGDEENLPLWERELPGWKKKEELLA